MIMKIITEVTRASILILKMLDNLMAETEQRLTSGDNNKYMQMSSTIWRFL